MTLSVRIPDEVYERLDNLAQATDRTKSYYVQQALIEQLDTMELVYIAQQRSEAVRGGKMETTPWKEIKNTYGL